MAMTATAEQDEIDFIGLSHIVLEVSSAEETSAFYQDVLGLEGGPVDPWPLCGAGRTLRAGNGQHLILTENGDRPDLRDTGVHHAFGVSPARREQIAAKLGTLGVEIFTYGEDPPGETGRGFYFFDPDGNRVQLVSDPGANGEGPPAFHHRAVQVADILWTEQFYTGLLGLEPVHRVGWATADYARAKAWAEGKEDMAPGTRRKDRRYSAIVDKQVVPRVNMQVYLAAGESVLGVYLANKHFQEPPVDRYAGTPRTAFLVGPGSIAAAERRLSDGKWGFHGPVSHEDSMPIAESLYFRDPGGNFIELARSRDA